MNYLNNIENADSQILDVFSAARSGRVDLTESFLNSETDINQKNQKGHSILMLASYNGHYDLVKHLISAGADVNSVDQSSNSILMGVAFKGNLQIFELLIQAGANLDFENEKQQTALDYAIMFGRRDLIFRINQIQNSNRSSGRMDQVKAWINYIKN